MTIPMRIRCSGQPSLSLLCTRVRRSTAQKKALSIVTCSHHNSTSTGDAASFSAALDRVSSNQSACSSSTFSSENTRSVSCKAAANTTGDDVLVGGGDNGDGNNGNGPLRPLGGDGNDDGGEDRLLDLQEAEKIAAAQGISLPADFIEAANASGLRMSALSKYISLQNVVFSGLLARMFPWIRDRLIADHRFMFKVIAEVLIDSGCATVAEVRKRGSDFWQEFEFYLSDLLVGVVLDVALVSLLAPVAVIGKLPKSASATGIGKLLAKVPSAMFEASIPGVREYSAGARVACWFVKALEYSLAGIACGLVGQGIANSLMLLRRRIHGAREDDVAVPPLIQTALVWGMFMGLSSNTRYQVVIGLERVVDLTIARRVPQIAYGTSVAIRFVNNVIGGENFIDMARWAGVQ